MRSKGIGLLEIQRFSADHDILDTVFAGDAGEHGVFILRAGAVNVGVDLIGQACHLKEAAVFTRHCMSAPFQGIQDLLAGDLDDTHAVSEGMDLQDVVEGDVALGKGYADASAVYKGNVGSGLIKVCVCAEVAQVGLGSADDTDGLALTVHGFRIGDGQLYSRLGNDGLEGFVKLRGLCSENIRDLIFDSQKLRSRNIIVP